MFKSRLVDAKAIRHPQVLAVKRKSESDDSSDCRTSLESPTTHCYVLGTRPKRTLPRRALSTGQVEVRSSVQGINRNPVIRLDSDVSKSHMTPPRSKSATNLRVLDSILIIPHIGTRSIFTPCPPSLSRFYDHSRKSLDNKMDIDPSSSSLSITGKLHHLRLRSHKSAASLRPLMLSVPLRRQASQNSISTSARRASKYISDEDMHICTSTEDEDSDLESPSIPSVPSSATFFRNIRMKQTLRNAQDEENMSPSTGRHIHSGASFTQPKRLMNTLQSSNHSSPAPVVVIDSCETSGTIDLHHSKRVKRSRSRHGLAPPAF